MLRSNAVAYEELQHKSTVLMYKHNFAVEFHRECQLSLKEIWNIYDSLSDSPTQQPILNKLEYVDWVCSRLPEIQDKTDRECVVDCVEDCYRDEFTREDALAYVRLTEHVNPFLTEGNACRRMGKIAKKYRAPKSKVEVPVPAAQLPKPAILFDVKQLARAVKLACKYREESFDGEGYYKLDMDQACMAAVQKLKLPKELWQMISLSLHWWNDIIEWANSVLAGTADKDYPIEELTDMSSPDMMTAKKGGKKS